MDTTEHDAAAAGADPGADTAGESAQPDNLADMVRISAERYPDRPAFVYRNVRMTWREADDRVNQTAAAMRALGLTDGDRVAIALANVLDFPLAYFGALRAGLVAVPLNPGLAPVEMTHALQDSGARALVTSGAGAEAVAAIREDVPGLQHVLVGESLQPAPGAIPLASLASEQPTDAVVPTRGGESLAVLLYTSGTTGRPRGAMLSHRALLANLSQLEEIVPSVLGPEDVLFVVVPVFHVYGLNTGVGMAARRGACLVLEERFDPADSLTLIAREGITAVLGAPAVYTAWSLYPDLGQAFATVRLALSGAAPLPASVLLRFLEVTGRHVFEGYGLTESSPVLSSTLMSVVAKPDSIGRPIPGVELRLVSEDGRDVEPGDPGEIVARGANLFSGYWPDGEGGPDAEGWWHTGDVAIRDDEGDLQIVDRLKDLVLVNGFNVYPAEVERVLDKHPDIVASAVFGIPHPFTGEAVKAVVVLREGVRLSEEDVVAFCETRLARYKCPTSVEFTDSLPTTATGKIRKGVLRGTVSTVA